jgi:hypothetical protein
MHKLLLTIGILGIVALAVVWLGWDSRAAQSQPSRPSVASRVPAPDPNIRETPILSESGRGGSSRTETETQPTTRPLLQITVIDPLTKEPAVGAHVTLAKADSQRWTSDIATADAKGIVCFPVFAGGGLHLLVDPAERRSADTIDLWPEPLQDGELRALRVELVPPLVCWCRVVSGKTGMTIPGARAKTYPGGFFTDEDGRTDSAGEVCSTAIANDAGLLTLRGPKSSAQ